MPEHEVIRKFIQTFDQEQAMALVSKSPKTINELRDHVSYFDRTIPFVNGRADQANINAVARARSPAPVRSSDPRSGQDQQRSIDQRRTQPIGVAALDSHTGGRERSNAPEEQDRHRSSTTWKHHRASRPWRRYISGPRFVPEQASSIPPSK